jgi:hypothetical protein
LRLAGSKAFSRFWILRSKIRTRLESTSVVLSVCIYRFIVTISLTRDWAFAIPLSGTGTPSCFHETRTRQHFINQSWITAQNLDSMFPDRVVAAIRRQQELLQQVVRDRTQNLLSPEQATMLQNILSQRISPAIASQNAPVDMAAKSRLSDEDCIAHFPIR